VLRWLVSWIDRVRRRRLARAAARRHLEATTGQRSHLVGSTVLGEHAGGLVVRVCYGDTKPPRRAWYLIGAGGRVARSVSWDEAESVGERPWR
jgi:hypothetical protein